MAHALASSMPVASIRPPSLVDVPRQMGGRLALRAVRTKVPHTESAGWTSRTRRTRTQHSWTFGRTQGSCSSRSQKKRTRAITHHEQKPIQKVRCAPLMTCSSAARKLERITSLCASAYPPLSPSEKPQLGATRSKIRAPFCANAFSHSVLAASFQVRPSERREGCGGSEHVSVQDAQRW